MLGHKISARDFAYLRLEIIVSTLAETLKAPSVRSLAASNSSAIIHGPQALALDRALFVAMIEKAANSGRHFPQIG